MMSNFDVTEKARRTVGINSRNTRGGSFFILYKYRELFLTVLDDTVIGTSCHIYEMSVIGISFYEHRRLLKHVCRK